MLGVFVVTDEVLNTLLIVFMKSNPYNNMKTISILFIISLLINGSVTESVRVNIGFSITFYTNTVIQSDDVIEWRYGFNNELIAKLDRGSISLFNSSYGRFSDRLKINNQTGDLTVIDIRSIGGYHLQITGEKNTRKSFSVIGRGGYTHHVTSLTVMEGDSVRLDAGVPDSENYDVIRWRFENSHLTEINRKTKIISTHDERFRDRLELNQWSADLTITNITTDLSGLYEVNVDSNSGTHTIHRSYTVTVSDEVKSVSVMEGESVTLHIDIPIQRYDRTDWRFGPDELTPASIKSLHRYGERFRGRLQRNTDGSLTITNVTTEDSGVYQVRITMGLFPQSIEKRFIVTVTARDGSSGVSLGGSCVGVLLVLVSSQIL